MLISFYPETIRTIRHILARPGQQCALVVYTSLHSDIQALALLAARTTTRRMPRRELTMPELTVPRTRCSLLSTHRDSDGVRAESNYCGGLGRRGRAHTKKLDIRIDDRLALRSWLGLYPLVW